MMRTPHRAWFKRINGFKRLAYPSPLLTLLLSYGLRELTDLKDLLIRAPSLPSLERGLRELTDLKDLLIRAPSLPSLERGLRELTDL